MGNLFFFMILQLSIQIECMLQKEMVPIPIKSG